MPFDKLPTYGDEELEERANRFLKDRLSPGVTIPVKVEWLAETLPGVDLDCYPALRANHAIDGGVWADKDTGRLLIGPEARSAAPALHKLRQDRDHLVRKAAQEALTKIHPAAPPAKRS